MSPEAAAVGVLFGLSVCWTAVIAWVWHRWGLRGAQAVFVLLVVVMVAGVVAAAGGQA